MINIDPDNMGAALVEKYSLYLIGLVVVIIIAVPTRC